MSMPNNLTLAENERRLVARILHDEAIQTLQQINMQIGICKQYLEHNYITELNEELDFLEQQSLTASHQLRALMNDLRPPVNPDGRFLSALETTIKSHQNKGGPLVVVEGDLSMSLSETSQLALLRILQEGLQNIRRHAKANKVTLTIQGDAEQMDVNLCDDGLGFEENEIIDDEPNPKKMGLYNMKLRAEAIKADLSISSEPDKGTCLKVSFS